MSDFLSILDVSIGLATVRIGLGLWWLKSVLHKPYPSFLKSGMANWTVSLAENHPVQFLAKPIGAMVDKGRSWFPYLVVFGEAAVAIGLTLGFLTPISLVVAIFLNLNYLFLAGFRPKDISVNIAYQSEQGQNWNMLVPEVVLLLTGAWTTWSLDAALGLF